MASPAITPRAATLRAIHLTLDWWPAELKPNGSRGMPHVHNRAAQAYREGVRKMARSQAIEQAAEQGFSLPLEAPVRAVLTFVVPTLVARDLDNNLAAWKPGLDGIVDAGIIRSDSMWELTRIDLRGRHDATLKQPRVEVLLEGWG